MASGVIAACSPGASPGTSPVPRPRRHRPRPAARHDADLTTTRRPAPASAGSPRLDGSDNGHDRRSGPRDRPGQSRAHRPGHPLRRPARGPDRSDRRQPGFRGPRSEHAQRVRRADVRIAYPADIATTRKAGAFVEATLANIEVGRSSAGCTALASESGTIGIECPQVAIRIGDKATIGTLWVRFRAAGSPEVAGSFPGWAIAYVSSIEPPASVEPGGSMTGTVTIDGQDQPRIILGSDDRFRGDRARGRDGHVPGVVVLRLIGAHLAAVRRHLRLPRAGRSNDRHDRDADRTGRPGGRLPH